MDVQDRSTRLDIVTVAAPPQISGTTSTPASAVASPSFAESLQRAPQSQSAVAKSESAQTNSHSVATAGEPPPDSTLTQSNPSAATSPDAAVSNSSADESLPAASQDPLLAPDGPAESIIELAPDEVHLLSLVAGLIANPGAPVPQTTNHGVPGQHPPDSLLKALQANSVSAVDAASITSVEADAALPVIPAGLQAGLAPAADRNSIAAATQSPGDQIVSHIPETTVTHSLANVTVSAATKTTKSPQAPVVVGRQLVEQTPARSIPGQPASSLLAKLSSVDVTPVPAQSTDGLAPDRTAVSNDFAQSGTIVVSEKPAVSPTSISIGDSPDDGTPSPDALSAAKIDLATAAVVAVNPVPAQTDPVRSARAPAENSRSARLKSDELSPLSGLTGLMHELTGRASGPVHQDSGTPPAAGISPAVPAVVDQLAPALQQAAESDRELTMTLRPPELGSVRIEVSRHDGQLSARLQTETASAHQLLTDQLPQLREVLLQLGVSADQVQIVRAEAFPTDAGPGSRSEGQTEAQNSGGRQEPQQHRTPESQLAEEPEREDANRPGIRTRTALNLRI